jgi:hypothetical protein
MLKDLPGFQDMLYTSTSGLKEMERENDTSIYERGWMEIYSLSWGTSVMPSFMKSLGACEEV